MPQVFSSRSPRTRIRAAALVAALGAGAAVAAGSGMAPDADARAAKAVKCPPSGATTIYSTPKVRIFSRGSHAVINQRVLYGCLSPNGRARFLFAGATNETSSNVRIAADRFVSVGDFRVVPIDGMHESSLSVMDLTTGKRTSVDIGDTPGEDDFVLLNDGSMVFVDRDYDDAIEDYSPTKGTLVRVPFTGAGHTFDRQVLDTGTITDLAVSASAVYWTKDGVAVKKAF